MGRITQFDHYATGADLQIATWDSYPIGFLSDRLEAEPAHRQRYLRQGDPDFQAFHHDLYRAVGRGRWWVMEQQPGPVNWAPWNPAPLPGMVRLWAWEAFAHGAETVSYFRWRQLPFGQEQMHAGLLRPDANPAPGLAEVAQVAQELADAPDAGTAPAPVALIFDYASQWAWDTQPQGKDFDYFRLCFEVYRAARSLGLTLDILPPDTADLSGYRLVLAPGLATMPPALLNALGALAAPTVALIGPRSNSRTPEMATPVPLPPNLPGLDLTVTAVESLPPGTTLPLTSGGRFHRWVEHVEGSAPVSATASTGQPAVIGDGPVRYLCGWPDPEGLQALLIRLCGAAGLPAEPMPDGLRQRDTGRQRFVINYGPEPVTWRGQTIPGPGVTWETT
jgi:beta-galactosidase